MSELSRYCSHCGAANAPGSQFCFSCQQSLVERDEAAQGIVLIGRYQLLTQVGSGGFGGVYRSVDLADGQRAVAVKEINLRGLSAQEIIEATDGFNREVGMLSPLRHPHLPRIRDTFTDAEHWYVVMDFIEGETLETYLTSKVGSRLPLQEVLELALQLCIVLDYLHTREPAIIFRDLKPSNVMRTSTGQIYLIDFGIARLFSPGKLKDTMPFGSPGYAAPEQYGRAQTTQRADIYSLGALLHFMLTGHDPAESPFRFAPLPIADSSELAELDGLIQRMVATMPEERPASVAEVKALLQRLSAGIRQQEQQQLWPAWTPAAPAPVPASVSGSGITRRKALSSALKIGGAVVGVGGLVSVCGGLFYVVSRPRHFYGVVALPPPSPGAAKQTFIYREHKGPITALSWSPDGQMVASGSVDGTVQVWRAADGALLYTLSGYTDAVTSVVWASDRTNVIASAGNRDGTVQVWDALRDHREMIFHGDGRVLALAWQAKSPWMASGGTDRDIYTWNATTGVKGVSYRGHKGNVNALLWLSGNNSSASGLSQAFPAETPTATPTPPPTPAPPAFSSPTPPPTPAYPTPTLPLVYQHPIASGGADGTVQIWNAKTGKTIATYGEHTGGVNGLAFIVNQSATIIASASDDRTVRAWVVGAGTSAIYRGHADKVNAVTALYMVPSTYYAPSFISASDDQTVQAWSYRDGYRPLITYTAHHAPVKTVAASPVDNRVVSGDSAGLVHMWTMIPPRNH